MQHLLIDTNVLLLLLIGRWDRNRIGTFRRTREFTVGDFDLLESTLAVYGGLIVTGPLLTEASNLMGNAFHETIAGTIKTICGGFTQRSATKEEVFADADFDRLGYADASVLQACTQDTVVLTDDVQLYLAVLDRGFEAVNFNHLRDPRPST